ncbi:response regulator [Pseudoalteromonas sp.]|uniref:response regulator n=1 Tax=Pseudoalteromonas sp. TaxID=53249 RepID=UPI002626C5F0|nr:response regulator [Pseudoalteromonas sp.]MCP4586580.1 response regulator [Pseudoalteromonas sp.]
MLFSHHNNSHNKVLVVDDEPTSLLIMAESLSDLGEIVCCDNGAQAIEKAASFQPDVILLDIEMPDMNGFEVCQKLKNNPKTAPSHVIFVTSHNEQIFEYQSFASGGIDLIHKPVDLNICRLRVQNQLKLKHQEAQILAAKNDISTLVTSCLSIFHIGQIQKKTYSVMMKTAIGLKKIAIKCWVVSLKIYYLKSYMRLFIVV